MYKLIIVDDEKNIREGLALCYPWKELGFEVAGSFPNGKEALEYIERCCVDVVLSDIRMPKMDGLMLAEHLFKNYPHICTVLLSGYAEFEYARTAIRFQVREYILKPVKYEDIIAVFTEIKEALDLKRGVSKSEEPFIGYYDQIVEQTLSYLKDHYKNATLLEASKKVGLSPNYLSKIFKRKKGINFSDALLEVKMEKAAILLQDAGMKAYQVADEVGYDNPKNFSRAFKQYYGKTPKEYREQDLSL